MNNKEPVPRSEVYRETMIEPLMLVFSIEIIRNNSVFVHCVTMQLGAKQTPRSVACEGAEHGACSADSALIAWFFQS
jgi:hypothetical protein